MNRIRFAVAIILSCVIGTIAFCEDAKTLALSAPTTRIVYQRNNDNQAVIPIAGKCAANVTSIEARLISRAEKPDAAAAWNAIDADPKAGTFHGALAARGGWYNLEVRAMFRGEPAGTATVERVGVGEVFIIMGHSVAQGQDINLPGATDDRVSTVSLNEEAEAFNTYHKTGDPTLLPTPDFVHFTKGIKPAPYGHGTYFWSNFAENVAKKQNVPVLFYNAAFGGTSLEHWAKSSQGIQFPHSFVRAKIRMPYINLYNTLKKYIPLTGIRAVLADQGANDWPEKNADVVYEYYQTTIKQSRADLSFPNLAIVVNRHTPFMRDKQIRNAQERVLQTPDCFPGPDYDTFAKEDRPDSIHIGAAGAVKAAAMWANALDEKFFKESKPWLPEFKSAVKAGK